MGSKVLKFPHRWAGRFSDKWCAEPRSESDSGDPTVRDRRAALRNVVSHAYGVLVRALNFEPDNRTHGSTGGDWKRNATASPRQPPTQPRSIPQRGTSPTQSTPTRRGVPCMDKSFSAIGTIPEIRPTIWSPRSRSHWLTPVTDQR